MTDLITQHTEGTPFAPPPSRGILLRVLPTGLYAGRARMLVHRAFLVNRRTWMALFSGFFEPIFYLIALGEISWALLRGGLYAVGFLLVMAVGGLLTSPWALLALPAALLIALAFAAVGMAATTFLRSWQDFDLVQLAIMPMFFFSTTFYPLSVYPRPLQIAVECFPLYHGVTLMRQLSTGFVDWSALGHAAYFVVMAVIGAAWAAKRLKKLLLK
jgi:ABC-type polysaccharide/polyol phosphate export permease